MEFKESIATQKENVIVRYRREIEGCENIIKSQKEKEKELRQNIKELTQEKNIKDELTGAIDKKFKGLESTIKSIVKQESKEVPNAKTFAEIVLKSNINKRERIEWNHKNVSEEIRAVLKEEKKASKR